MRRQRSQAPNRVVRADQGLVGGVGRLGYRAQRSLGWQRLGFQRRDALRHSRERWRQIVERLAQACVFRRRAVELQSGVGKGLSQRIGGLRRPRRIGDTGRFIGQFCPGVGQGALSADCLGARNDVGLDVRLLALRQQSLTAFATSLVERIG
jgi:hypothetical protein